MATYTTQCPGNLAMQTEVWTLTLDEAKQALTLLDARTGSYWDTNLTKPTRRNARLHLPTVRVYTAGFSSGELSNVLYASGATVTRST
jgi:hypothetical protein